MNRRNFLSKTSLGLAASSLSVPFAFSQSKTSYDGTVVGHGTHRYRVDTKWAQTSHEKHPVRDCHEMVQSSDGRLFMLTNHTKNNIIVFDTRGKVIDI